MSRLFPENYLCTGSTMNAVNENRLFSFPVLLRTEKNELQQRLSPEAREWLDHLQVPRLDRRVNIFLRGFPRGGTSLTSLILASHPSAIYFREPHFPYINVSGATAKKFRPEFYRGLWTCEIGNILVDLPFYYFKSFILAIWPYSEHMAGFKLPCLPGLYSRLIRNVEFMNRFCSKHSVRIVKEVNLFPMTHYIPLMDDPNLNVIMIQLWRDPRRIMKSRLDEYWCFGECQNVSHFCSEVLQDLDDDESFAKAYPNRYISLHFEDMQSDPHGFFSALFWRLGIPWDAKIGEYIDANVRNYSKIHSTDELDAPVCKTALERLYSDRTRRLGRII